MGRIIRILTAAGLTVCLVLLALLVAAPFHIYHRFTETRPIAELYFEPLGPQAFTAHVATGDFCIYDPYLLYGDEFRLDADFLVWRPVATLLGAAPLYRIDRLSGRYRSSADETTRPRSAHALGPEVVFDPFRFSGPAWLVDTRFGASVYQAIDPTLRYTVYRSPTGLLVRSRPIIEPVSADLPGVIVIDRGCGDRPPARLGRLARWTNDVIGRAAPEPGPD